MSGPQGYRFAGDVQLTNVIFVGIDSRPIDITEIVSTVNVYQNIFRHYMECELIFTDASKFIHNLPQFKEDKITGGFTGTEVVVIQYKENGKTGKEKVYTHTFRMHSLSDRNSLENSELYLMSGISEEGWQLQSKRISKTFGGSSGSTIQDMMKSLFKEYFKSSTLERSYKNLSFVTNNKVNKNLNSMETIGVHKFIVPNWTIGTTIDFFCDEADCASRVPYFLFYEDSENFNFSNVNNLTKQEPVDEYFYAKTNIESPGGDDEVIIPNDKIITGYKINRQIDFLENVQTGLYKSSTNSVDTLKKKTKTVVYDYQKYAPIFNKLQERIIAGVVQQDVPVYSLMTSRTGHDVDPLFESEKPLPKHTNVTRDIRQSFMSSVFNTALEVSIPGNPNLKVGQVIKLSFPVDTQESDLEEEDKYLTGNYLITKVRQLFTPNSTETLLECTKDGGIT